MCVNDILTSGAEPLFFLDYFATGKLRLDEAQAVIEGIAAGCAMAGCALIGGETAEMPGMYGAGEYDLAGFAVGAVERERLLDGRRVEAGHRLLGLASSGPHSNGYSLIRKIIERSAAELGQLLPGTPGGTTTLGAALLEPTRIYVREVLLLLQRGGVDALAHITGGGLTENIVRSVPPRLGIEIDLQGWQRPAVFDWLQHNGDIAEREMLRTFNCGIGMVMVASPNAAANLVADCHAHGLECFEIGAVVPRSEGPRVRYL